MTPPADLVRLATLTDIPELVRLWLLMSTNRTPDKHDHLAKALTDRVGDGLEGFVIDSPTGLAACAVGVVLPGIARLRGHLHLVTTDPAHRRRGYATAVLRAVIEQLRAHGCTRIELNSSPEGEALYHSLGFVPETIWRLKTDGFS